MIADLIDAMRENTHAFVSANSKGKPKAPEPYERPDHKRNKNKGSGGGFRAIAAAQMNAAQKRRSSNGEAGE